MTASRATEIMARLERAKAERQRLEPLFDDCMRLTMPARARFHSRNLVDRADDIFDETGANGVQEFVSRMQAGIVPPFRQFVELKASSLVDPRDRTAVNRDLEEITEYAFEEIWASNFAQESAEAFHDLAISTGTLLVEDGGARGALMHKAIPITDAYFERGPDDRVGGAFRVAKVAPQNIALRYKDAVLSPQTERLLAEKKDGETVDVVEYCRFEHNSFGMTYEVVIADTKEVIVDRRASGPGSAPFIPFRWATAAGETWGRGPLLNAIGAIRTTNLMVELVMENAAMQIVGIYQTDNEGVINAEQVNLLPGSILTKEIGTNGLEQVNTQGGNFSMRDVVLNDQRLNIRRALYNDMLADPNRTPASATEVAERMADLAYRTSAGFARVFHEFVQPYMMRVLYILEKRGDIQLPVQNGRAIKFHAVSPLAQAQHARELQMLMQDHAIRANIYGPQAAASHYQLKELLPWLKDRTGLSELIYASPEEVEQAMKDTMATAQDMQAAQGAMGQ